MKLIEVIFEGIHLCPDFEMLQVNVLVIVLGTVCFPLPRYERTIGRTTIT